MKLGHCTGANIIRDRRFSSSLLNISISSVYCWMIEVITMTGSPPVSPSAVFTLPKKLLNGPAVVRHWRHPCRQTSSGLVLMASSHPRAAGCLLSLLSLLSGIWIIIIIIAIPMQMNHTTSFPHLSHSSYPIRAWPHEGQCQVSSGYWAVIGSPGCLIISSCPDMSRYVSSRQLSCLTAR